MSHPRTTHPMDTGDTTYTKIFVGGLAWETHRETMRHYFEQFGEIQEAVVITDKKTGRSKGYGFVTFKDPDAAMRACQDPSPVIDGRRANCNLACVGAHRTRPPSPRQGAGRLRPAPGSVNPTYPAAPSSSFFRQPSQYSWYSGNSQENMYPMNYYNVYGGNQFSPYYPLASPGIFQNYYPFYAQYSQSSQPQSSSFGMQYLVQYPYLRQQHGTTAAIVSLPAVAAVSSTATGMTGSGSSSLAGMGATTGAEQQSSSD